MNLQQMYNQTGKYRVENSHSIRAVMDDVLDARVYEFFSNEGELIFSFHLGRYETCDMIYRKNLKDCERLYFRMFAGPQNIALDFEEYLRLLKKKTPSPEWAFVRRVMNEYGYSVTWLEVQDIVHETHRWLYGKNMGLSY